MFLLSLLACTRTPAPLAPTPAAKPVPQTEPIPLTVLVVVDQLPVRLLDRPAELYTGGLARLLRDGRRATARYSHAITYTCPGHATISTGVSPAEHGIVSNHWRDPADPGTTVYCADPALLTAPAIADAVVDAGGKAASIALKDRAAVMLGGHRPTLVSWYDREAGAFTGPLAGRIDVAARFRPWEALHPDRYEAWVGPDAGVHEHDPGIGIVFPHPAPNARTFLSTPHAGDALVDAALLAVADLSLGADATPDLLALSFSQTDYIGHAFTAESWEALDGMVRLDRSLGRLFDALDDRIGPDAYRVVLTSDHGAMEASTKRRVAVDAVAARAQEALVATGVAGTVQFEPPTLYLPTDLPDERRADVARAVAEAVRGMPGIGRAWAWRHEEPPPDVADAMRASISPGRSGDVYVMRAEDTLYDYLDVTALGTSHGTPFDEDALVPLLVWPTAEGPLPDTVDVKDVAPLVRVGMGLPPRPPKESP
jgi:hypothetical protein